MMPPRAAFYVCSDVKFGNICHEVIIIVRSSVITQVSAGCVV